MRHGGRLTRVSQHPFHNGYRSIDGHIFQDEPPLGRALHVERTAAPLVQALPEGADGPALLAAELMDVQGPLARVVEIRPALPQEETDYLRGNLPKNILCPTGRRGNP